MKIVVIGGTGLIGSKLVTELSEHGHEAVAGSPSLGINTITGQGLAEGLVGASVVIDVSNPHSFDYASALGYFETSARNLRAEEERTGVGHHVALSIVGTEFLSESGYVRAKIAQEALIKASPIPYSIVRATQFFESIKKIAEDATYGNTMSLAPVLTQPVAAGDVAKVLAAVAMGTPVNGIVEVAGPERFSFDMLIRRCLGARQDPRVVLTDFQARYLGAVLGEHTLVPGEGAIIGETHFDDWLRGAAPAKQTVA